MSDSRDDTRRADAGRDDAGQDGATPREGATDQEFPIAGFGHALHLLLMAIAKTNAAVGPLLDEFTAKHADYLRELQESAGGGEPAQATDNFILASRLIYKRLSDLQARQAAARREHDSAPVAARLH